VASRYLVDTNLLIYPHDGNEPTRAARASEVLRRVVGGAALPVQALAEFAVVALRKLEPPLPASEVYSQIERLSSIFDVVPLTAPIVLEAVRAARDHHLAYFDAQVWAAAKLAQIPVVLSEDFSVGSSLEGVTFLNPLDAAFDLDLL
jgi:predicted nucleic acid-binding protein